MNITSYIMPRQYGKTKEIIKRANNNLSNVLIICCNEQMKKYFESNVNKNVSVMTQFDRSLHHFEGFI